MVVETAEVAKAAVATTMKTVAVALIIVRATKIGLTNDNMLKVNKHTWQI